MKTYLYMSQTTYVFLIFKKIYCSICMASVVFFTSRQKRMPFKSKTNFHKNQNKIPFQLRKTFAIFIRRQINEIRLRKTNLFNLQHFIYSQNEAVLSIKFNQFLSCAWMKSSLFFHLCVMRLCAMNAQLPDKFINQITGPNAKEFV